MTPRFDNRDKELLASRQAARETLQGPRVGDFAEMPDGRTMRFSNDLGRKMQISEDGSYYLCKSGQVSMSGGLEPGIDKSKLVDTEQTADGAFWFFHHDHATAHNGVYCAIPCRVYRYTGKSRMPTYT